MRVPRPPECFISKSGKVVKTCNECRAKDAKQSKKPTVRARKNDLQREKRYYVAYREKKRAEDEDGFLAHNAKMAKIWRDSNMEHLAKWKTLNLCYRITAIKQQARKKSIPWDLAMTDEYCKTLMEGPCAYCVQPVTTGLHGIDRMNNNAAYTISNCVGCCKMCNFIKKCLDPTTFIERCQHISFRHGDVGALSPDSWMTSHSVSFGAYASRAAVKCLAFELSVADFAALVSGACHYCQRSTGHGHTNGVDRKVNNIGYSRDNCVTCCCECNHAKGGLNDIEFIEHCKVIARVWEGKVTPFTGIPRILRVVSKRTMVA